MTHLLIITTLDVEGRRNNREHHAIRHLAPQFDRVTVVYRRRGAVGKSLWQLLQSRQIKSETDGVTYLGVDPPLNPPEGTVRNLSNGAGRPSILRKVVASGLDVLGIVRDKLTIRGLAKQGALALRDHRETVVCEAFGPWASAAAQQLRRDGLLSDYVYIDRDYEPGFMTSSLRRRWAKRAEFRAARNASLTLSIGQRLADRFAGEQGASIKLSPTGVDTATFSNRQRKTPTADLIFVGRAAVWSGLDEVLDAMASIALLNPTLRIVGPIDPPFQRVLDQKIATLRLDQAVVFLGDQTRDVVAAEIDRASIGLACFQATPLRIFAAPLKLLEYMSAGLPVIAVAGSESGDMTSRFGVGETCATQGPALAAAITKLCETPADYAAMSKAGPVAAADFEWSRIMQTEYGHLADIYDLKAWT